MKPALAVLLLFLFNPGIGGGDPPVLWVLPSVVLILSLLFGYMALVDMTLRILPSTYKLLYSKLPFLLCRPCYSCLCMLRLGALPGVAAVSMRGVLPIDSGVGGIRWLVYALSAMAIMSLVCMMPFVRRRLRGKQPAPLIDYDDLEAHFGLLRDELLAQRRNPRFGRAALHWACG